MRCVHCALCITFSGVKRIWRWVMHDDTQEKLRKNMNLTQPRCDEKNIIHEKDEFHMDPPSPFLILLKSFKYCSNLILLNIWPVVVMLLIIRDESNQYSGKQTDTHCRGQRGTWGESKRDWVDRPPNVWLNREKGREGQKERIEGRRTLTINKFVTNAYFGTELASAIRIYFKVFSDFEGWILWSTNLPNRGYPREGTSVVRGREEERVLILIDRQPDTLRKSGCSINV